MAVEYSAGMIGTPLTPPPLVYAHRGDRTRAADNTLEAYRLAVEAGSDGIELDVRRTSDGALILSHDDRYPGMSPFIELTMAEVRDQAPDVPTLVQMLSAVPSHIWLNVEIKNDPRDPDFDPTRSIVDQTIETIAEYDSLARILLSSFDPESMQRASDHYPELLRGQLLTTPLDLGYGIEIAVAQKGRAVHPAMSYFRADAAPGMQMIHDAGLAAVVWGANTPDDVATLLGVGVDVIITDDPAMARRLVDQR
ncbi:MAG: glycerophosphodiester phosphodiesterase [Acidimicrobiia bacterium]|nr:MAG: glycerophosphodiester phosphodiesterase [Acidimicrobiia bacterium]